MMASASTYLSSSATLRTPDHDRRLATVRVLDPRARQVEHHEDGLLAAGSALLEHGVEAPAQVPELPERVQDAGRPVDPGNEAPGLPVLAPGEGGLDNPGDPVLLALDFLVLEALHLGAQGLRPCGKVIPADDAESHRLDGPRVRLHGVEEALEGAPIEAVPALEGRQVDTLESRRFEHRLLLRGGR